MKYAICISGDLRTGLKAWKHNLFFFQEYGSSYYFFIDVWEKGSSPKRKDSLVELILNLFFKLAVRYEQPKTVEPKEILETFKEFENVYVNIHSEDSWEAVVGRINRLPAGRLGRKILGSMRMFFLMEQCSESKKLIEDRLGTNFDAVLRVRPDSILTNNPFSEFKSLDCDLVFYQDPNQSRFKWGPVNDQVFVGNSDVMSKVTNAFSALIEYSKNNDWSLPKGSIHEVLVAESALSFHVRGLREKYSVKSSSISTELLRPRVCLKTINNIEFEQRKSESRKLLKHFIRITFARITGI